MEWYWTSRHLCCIDNLPTKVSQCKLASLMKWHWSSSFSLWFSMDQEECLIEWHQVRRHIRGKVSPKGNHVLSPSHHIRHPYYHACSLCGTETAYMPVTETQNLQACVCNIGSAKMYVTRAPTNRNAGYSNIGSVCISVILVQDQQPNHYCHRVSKHLYHYACLIIWHRTSTHAETKTPGQQLCR